MAARASLRLMPLGGSITYGVGSSYDNRYRKFLYELIGSCGYNVIMPGSRQTGTMDNNSNEGWRGFGIHAIQEKGIKLAKVRLPDIFTVSGDSKDCIQDFEIGHSGERIDYMLHHLWEVSPGLTIILSALVQNNDALVNPRAVQENSQIRELDRQRSAEGNGLQVSHLVDRVYPNDIGYGKLADIWHNSIQTTSIKGFIR
ncbi:SGNH hydrolase-type esterase domain-containing protein [Nemania sp. FL0031]|nr:SGNH hydrolase-type esterase domain-containing protein [Nemania sp. FL0031]